MMTSMNRGWRAVRGHAGPAATGRSVLVLLAGLLLVALAGPAEARGPWDAQPAQSTYVAAFSLRVDLLSLNRPSSDAVVATFRVTNVGSTDRHLGLVLGTQDDVGSAAGFALLDAEGMDAYLPLAAQDGACVCSLFDTNLAPGESRGVFVWFPAPPAEVESLAVLVPNAAPLLDVPVGSSTAPVPAPEGQPTRDPAQLDLRPAQVQKLVSVTEDLEETRTVEDDGDDKRVRLSADVLFEINKANLTSEARGILDDVAAQIDDSDTEVVHVDGHTDITGGDAINIPLSKRRAATVRDALEEMVDRDVRFDAEGHGSARPVAPNDTEEGRRLNRRVTVTFAQ